MKLTDAHLWLSLIAVLFIAEAVTTNFVTIWFAFGALIALLASFVIDDFTMQLTIFIVSSTILVLSTLPFVKKMRSKKTPPLNADRNLGRTATVLEALQPGEQGRVRLDGVDWSAIAESPIAQGETCRVIAINSTVLTVEPVPQTTRV